MRHSFFTTATVDEVAIAKVQLQILVEFSPNETKSHRMTEFKHKMWETMSESERKLY
jgi:hypothetical protein